MRAAASHESALRFLSVCLLLLHNYYFSRGVPGVLPDRLGVGANPVSDGPTTLSFVHGHRIALSNCLPTVVLGDPHCRFGSLVKFGFDQSRKFGSIDPS